MNEKVALLSHPLDKNTPLYGGERSIEIIQKSAINNGDNANTLQLSFPNHAGTHIDVPFHFYSKGKKLTDYEPSHWIFNKPVCVDVPAKQGQLILFSDVSQKLTNETDLLLIRTGFEKLRNTPEYWSANPGLSTDLAQGIRFNFPNIRAVGVDCISITSYLHRSDGRVAHREFLNQSPSSNHIVLIEDMSLANYTSGYSQVVAFPLLISDSDGAPCSVIAW